MPRRRVVARDAAEFELFARLLVLAMFLNIATGAFVRLTGSGLGCPDWPACEGRPVPPFSYHPVIEFSNRAIALHLSAEVRPGHDAVAAIARLRAALGPLPHAAGL